MLRAKKVVIDLKFKINAAMLCSAELLNIQ